MGQSASSQHFPTSTSTLCVLPLRTNGQSRFSISAGPMPASVSSRLTEAEFYALVETINKVLQQLSHFGLLSILLPFVLIDIITILLLFIVDPGILFTPWEYSLTDLALPMLLEFGLIFCGFPAIVYVVNRRMELVQAQVRSELDVASRRFGARGVNFQLKQGVAGNGAATNMWIELSVLPLIQESVALLLHNTLRDIPSPRSPCREL